MRSILVIPLAAAIALCGCNKHEAADPKTQEQAKAEVAKLAKPKPGLYRLTMKVTTFDVPGMSAAQSAQMKQVFAAPQQGRDFCLTPEQASKGYEEAMKQQTQGKCNYDRFAVTGNTLDAKMTCETGRGMSSQIEMNGTVTEESTQMKMKMEQRAPGVPGGSVKMEMEAASQRVGDCPGARP